MKEVFEEYIDFIIGDLDFLSFNEHLNAFEIKETNLTWSQIQTLRDPLERMRHTIPPLGIFETRVSDIDLGFYDKYLEDYCSDRLEKGKSIQSTDLMSKGNKTFVIGRSATQENLSLSNKLEFVESLKYSKDPYRMAAYAASKKNKDFVVNNLSIIEGGWIKVFIEDPIIYKTGMDAFTQYYKEKIKRVFGYHSEDRIIGVINNIRKNGWDNNLSWKPHIGSESIQGGIIGISTESGTYSLLTGRHRVTAAVYLFKKGEIKETISFDYPRLVYRWKTWYKYL